MIILKNYNPYYRNNNICYIMQNNNYDLIDNTKYNNINIFENIFLDGIQNFVIISSVLLINRTLYGNNTNKIIIKLTNPLINLSKKIINFNNISYQISFSSAILAYMTIISGVSAKEK